MALRRSLRCHSPPTDGKGRQKKERKRDDFKYHGHFISFSLSFSRLSRLDFVRERKTFFKALREPIHVASTAKNKISVRILKKKYYFIDFFTGTSGRNTVLQKLRITYTSAGAHRTSTSGRPVSGSLLRASTRSTLRRTPSPGPEPAASVPLCSLSTPSRTRSITPKSKKSKLRAEKRTSRRLR